MVNLRNGFFLLATLFYLCLLLVIVHAYLKSTCNIFLDVWEVKEIQAQYLNRINYFVSIVFFKVGRHEGTCWTNMLLQNVAGTKSR